MICFREHIPGCCDYGQPAKVRRKYLSALLANLEANFNMLPPKDTWVWAYDVEYCGEEQTLMIVSTKEEGDWWVIGYVKGIDLSKYLPKYNEVYKNLSVNEIKEVI